MCEADWHKSYNLICMNYSIFTHPFLCVAFIGITMVSCSSGSNVKTTGFDASSVPDPLAPPVSIDTQGKVIMPGDSTKDTIAAPFPNDNYRVVPAKSVGRIDLGMREEVALAALGKPDATDAGMGTFVYTWMGKTKPYKSELNIVTGYADSDMKKEL